MNKMLEALYVPYVYVCDGEKKYLKNDDKTSEKIGMFLIHCDKCCEQTVLHLLERGE